MRSAYNVGAAWLLLMRWRARRLLASLLSRPRFAPALRFDPTAPTLVLSPHLDDAVINCWSVLTADRDKLVVNVFAGVPPAGVVTRWDRECGAADSAEQVRARVAEDREVLGRLGVRGAYLDLLEAQYDRRRPSLAMLDAAVGASVSAASTVYAPAALGLAHRDHLLVREYARRLAAHGMPVMLYADFPYAMPRGTWPSWVDTDSGRRRAPALWRPALRAMSEGGAASIARLPPSSATAKLEAMRGYRTQFPGLDRDGWLSDPAVHGVELFWRLRPRGASAPSRRAAPVGDTQTVQDAADGPPEDEDFLSDQPPAAPSQAADQAPKP